jgi:hypothetical protein
VQNHSSKVLLLLPNQDMQQQAEQEDQVVGGPTPIARLEVKK